MFVSSEIRKICTLQKQDDYIKYAHSNKKLLNTVLPLLLFPLI